MRTKEKRGFTIIELLAVIAMLLVLMGAVTTSITRARRRAKIQQAITEAQQLTDAILAYENFSRPGMESPLERKAKGVWEVAEEGKMAFVLGREKMSNGQEGNVPVLYNGAVSGGSIRDPWGNPYRFRIVSASVVAEDDHDGSEGESAFAIPNINRIPADEVN
jgi:prepilin-type N-terminal cleavage/methylation domain-containing protein